MVSFSLRDNVVVRYDEGGGIILDENNGTYWQINPSAALVLEIIIGTASLVDAADALAAKYNIDRAAAEGDVVALLLSLEASGLAYYGDK